MKGGWENRSNSGLSVKKVCFLLATSTILASCHSKPAQRPVAQPTATLGPISPVSSGSQTASAIGQGVATNNAANGSGSQAGSNNKSNSDNPQAPKSVTVSGTSPNGQTVVINVASGATLNLTLSNNKPFTVGASPKKKRAIQHYNGGTNQLKNGNFKGAAIALNFAIVAEPDFAEAHNNYAILLLHEGRIEQAKIELHEAIRLQPNNVVYQNNLARALAGAGPVVLLEKIATSDPDRLTYDAFRIENQGAREIYIFSGKGVYLDDHGSRYSSISLPIPPDNQDETSPLVPRPRPSVGIPHKGSITIKTPKVSSSGSMFSGVLMASRNKIQELDFVLIFAHKLNGEHESSTFHFMPNISPSRSVDWSLKLDTQH